ncbi:hypothetical protein G7Y89_g37 [Cudoniella acicularis]|uniref:Uncharacterized protein n=1 Tax=Cudoniella acicularis TaxID=354080 RepID=A0A8H4RY33_9HELO|nr:hypothetical protein G7Y89_g37 [Cudoniella acicularis]
MTNHSRNPEDRSPEEIEEDNRVLAWWCCKCKDNIATDKKLVEEGNLDWYYEEKKTATEFGSANKMENSRYYQWPSYYRVGVLRVCLWIKRINPGAELLRRGVEANYSGNPACKLESTGRGHQRCKNCFNLDGRGRISHCDGRDIDETRSSNYNGCCSGRVGAIQAPIEVARNYLNHGSMALVVASVDLSLTITFEVTSNSSFKHSTLLERNITVIFVRLSSYGIAASANFIEDDEEAWSNGDMIPCENPNINVPRECHYVNENDGQGNLWWYDVNYEIHDTHPSERNGSRAQVNGNGARVNGNRSYVNGDGAQVNGNGNASTS